MRFPFIAKPRHIWPVSWLCEALDVSRSSFHAWLNRPTSAREIHDAKLVMAIETSFKASDRTYGARRVWRDVLEKALARGLHRIERLMRIMPYGRGPNAVESQRMTANGRSSPTTSSTANSELLGPTRNGWPTLPTSGRQKAGSTPPPCWICFPGASSAGP
jgi:transposase InsO family protein